MRAARFGILVCMAGCMVACGAAHAAARYEGTYFSGEGDVEYLRLLDIARRMFSPDPEFQNIPMLYTPAWNGFVEGPTWGAWWIQNSYGPTYCALPFYEEPYATFLQNAQAMWFNQMGDDKRADANGYIAPDGSLCDAAAPDWVVFRQGDGRHAIHDWGMEFTAAGLLMQAELLLIGRDADAIAHYVPLLERCANFIETRRDPATNLFLAGPAGNLLAPSYAGWARPDGTYDKAYLAGLSITYIAALDRLIELEKLTGNADKAEVYTERRDRARQGLPGVTTEEGYFIKSLDPDGTRHGVYGAEKHGYFESSPNHDAIAFRVVDDEQAGRIYAKIASIPLLRRHGVIIPNEPGLDDMYEPDTHWLWSHGNWVNGGHWSTCEARMVMAYYRLGKYDDARRSMEHMLGFACQFRMDNPLTAFGSAVYQPKEPINLCYDSFGPPAAFIRGLFEYLYDADGLTLILHVPPSITRLEQRFPVRFGAKRLFLSSIGSGPVTGVRLNGETWEGFSHDSVRFSYDALPERAHVTILLGSAAEVPESAEEPSVAPLPDAASIDAFMQSTASLARNRLPLRIGADSAGGNLFTGRIDGVQFYSRALAEEEVRTLAHSEEGIPIQSGLVASWDFDALSDGAYPSVTNPELAMRAVGEVEEAEGRHGRAVRLAGGWLEAAHTPAFDQYTAFTLAAWLQAESFPEAGCRIVDKIPVGSADGYLLDTAPGNALRAITPCAALGHDAQLPVNEWIHVAATYEAAGELRLYVNGVRVASAASAAESDASPLLRRIRAFAEEAEKAGLGESYESRHARLVFDAMSATVERQRMLRGGAIQALPDESESAAQRCYVQTALHLAQGLEKTLDSYASTPDEHKRRMYALWSETR